MFLDDIIQKCHNNLLTSTNKLALAYLISRGITYDDIVKYKIGFIGKILKNIPLEGADISEKENFNKWCGSNGKFVNNRIVFPIYSELGRPLGIETRGLDKRAMSVLKPKFKKSLQPLIAKLPDSTIRYKKFYFERSKYMPVYFGLNLGIGEIWKTKTVFLTEGIMDAIPLKKIKINTLSSLTANLNEYQIDWLRRYVSKVILLFDMDEKGHASSKRIERILGDNFTVFSIGIKGKDVNDFVTKYGLKELEKIINDKIQFVF